MINLIKNSFIAGLLIGLGCIANLSTNIPILGSLLFSLGLITVIIQQRKLYTGAIGYINSWKNIYSLSIMLLVNLIGISFICYLFQNQMDSSHICEIKCSESLYNAFIKSIGCGMCVYIAVEGYKKTNNLLIIILPVMLFILSGFDHCIANYGYMILNNQLFCRQLPIWIIGNSIGSLIISKL